MQTHELGKLCQLGQASLCGLQQREAIAHENRASAMNEIIELIGFDAALKLCNVYAGCSLYIPNAKAIKLAERNRHIKADRLAGAEIHQLAIKYQLTGRQIFSILK